MVISSITARSGGTTTSVHNFYKGLSASRHDVKVLTTSIKEEQQDIDDAIFKNGDFIIFATDDVRWRYAKRLVDYLKEESHRFDLIWIHGLWESTTYFAAKYALKNNVPYILTPHGMFEPEALQRKSLKKSLYWFFIEKKIFTKAKAIHCINSAERVQIEKYTSVKIFELANATPMEAFISKEYTSLKSIGFIGRLHEKKGLDLLIRSLSQVKELTLLIAGSGTLEYEAYLSALVKELALEERVHFLGFADEAMKQELFSKALFVVVPSYTEVLTIVALESIAASTPVLITRACHFDEIAESGSGMIIENNEVESIKEGMEKMLHSDIKVMSKNAYELAKEYSIPAITEKLEEQLAKLVKRA